MRVVVHKDTVYDVYNKQSVDAFHVTLAPVMKIMNLLPMPIEYCVCDGAARTAPATIEEGEETRCYDVALTGAEETARVCIKPEGCAEFTAAEASILPAASEKRESVEIVDASRADGAPELQGDRGPERHDQHPGVLRLLAAEPHG